MEKHLSVTQINMLARCEKQYEFRYVEGIKRPPAGAVIMGSAYHFGAEESLRAKIEHRLVATEEIRELVAEAFISAVDAEPEGVDWGDESPGVLKDGAVEVAGLYHEHITPHIDPVAVEVGWRFPIDEEWGVEGYADLIYDDTRGPVVADHKLSKRKSGVEKHLIQLSLYHIGLREDLGITPVRAEVHQGIRPGGRTGANVVIEQADKLLDDEFVRELLAIYVKKVESGLFAPTGIGNWICSPEYCGYWDLCVGRRRK